MAAGQVVLVLTGNPQHVLTMTGRHRAVLIVNMLSALVLIATGAVGAHWFGTFGLAAASALSVSLQNGLLWAIARRELGIWTHVGQIPFGQLHLETVVATTASKRTKVAGDFVPVPEPLPTSPA